MPAHALRFILALAALGLLASCKKPAPPCDSRCSPPRCTWSADDQQCIAPCKTDKECGETEACICDDPAQCLFSRAKYDIPWTRAFRCVPLSGPPASLRRDAGETNLRREISEPWLASLPELSRPQCDLAAQLTTLCAAQICEGVSQSPDGGIYFARVWNPDGEPVFAPSAKCRRDRLYVGIEGEEPEAPDLILSGNLSRTGGGGVRFDGMYVRTVQEPGTLSWLFCGTCRVDFVEKDGGVVAVGATEADKAALLSELSQMRPKLSGCYENPRVACGGTLRITVRYNHVLSVRLEGVDTAPPGIVDQCLLPRAKQWLFSRRTPEVELVVPVPCPRAGE